MLRIRKYAVLLLFMFVPNWLLLGQETPFPPISGNNPTTADTTVAKENPLTDSVLTIRKINITGNRKTKDRFIIREIPIKEGEQYPLSELVKKFEDARKQLMNTALFHEVLVALESTEGKYVDVLIEVRERWYLFPVPYFKYIDRNLNQWLVENKGSFKRVNYGVKVFHNNTTGINDKFNMWLINGYTKQISFNYDRLYIDKNMKWGTNIGVGYGKNREVNYGTENNKQLFFKDTSNFVRSFFRTNVELSYRRAIKTRHRFGVGFSSERVSDTISKLNPEYFQAGRDKLTYVELYYSVSYFDVDYIPYPLTGYLGEFHFVKKGFNKQFDMWQVMAKVGGGWKIGKDLYFSSRLSGTVKLPFRQPFVNQRLLGYSDFFMQGYEYYVIDGVAGGYLKATFTRQLFDFNIHYRLKKGGKVERIPFRIFAKAYGNTGYVHNPEPNFNNQLNNTLLYSGGFGIDVITIYDFSLKFEWSFNHLGQNGLYLHRKTGF